MSAVEKSGRLMKPSTSKHYKNVDRPCSKLQKLLDCMTQRVKQTCQHGGNTLAMLRKIDVHPVRVGAQ
jgi:hypothetical protein